MGNYHFFAKELKTIKGLSLALPFSRTDCDGQNWNRSNWLKLIFPNLEVLAISDSPQLGMLNCPKLRILSITGKIWPSKLEYPKSIRILHTN